MAAGVGGCVMNAKTYGRAHLMGAGALGATVSLVASELPVHIQLVLGGISIVILGGAYFRFLYRKRSGAPNEKTER